jgi:hypothetical protein
MQALHWFTRLIDGKPVKIWLSCASLTEDLRDCLGVTTESATRTLDIFISAAEPREVQDETLEHEFIHAKLWGKKSLRLHWKKEESLACELANAGKPYAWPRRPKGAKALEAYARKTGDQ